MRTIPEHATKVFEGIMFDVWQREQQLFDGSTATFEAVTREHTVCVFATQGNNLIMTYQKQPQDTDWYRDFPGGRVPRGKDLIAHAQVELLEETGMKSDDRSMYASYRVGGKVMQCINYYIAKQVYPVAPQTLDPGGEIIEVKPMDFATMIAKVIAGELGDVYLRNDILRMKLEGTIDHFRATLFS